MDIQNENGTAGIALAPAESTAEITNNFANLENLSSLLEASSALDEMEPVIQLTSEYVELSKPGETFKGIFIGFQAIKIPLKVSPGFERYLYWLPGNECNQQRKRRNYRKDRSKILN